MSCQQVPTAPAFNPYPRSVQVGEFEVAIGGGIWVAIRASISSRKRSRFVFRFLTLSASVAKDICFMCVSEFVRRQGRQFYQAQAMRMA